MIVSFREGLWINHLLCDAAVHGDTLTINKTALCVAQEEACVSNILRRAYSARRVKGMVFGAQYLILVNTYPAWGYAVNRDMIWRER